MLLLSLQVGRGRLPFVSRLKLQAVILGLVMLSFVGGHRQVKVLYEGDVPAEQQQRIDNRAATAAAISRQEDVVRTSTRGSRRTTEWPRPPWTAPPGAARSQDRNS